MNERDLVASEAVAGLEVDHLGAVGRQSADGGGDVLDLEGDVVHAGPALGEKTAHGSVLLERRQKLDAAIPDTHVPRLDALVLHTATKLDPRAKQPLVGRHRR